MVSYIKNSSYIWNVTGIFPYISYRQHVCIIVLMFCFLQFYIVDNMYAQYYSWEEFVEKISADEDNEYGYLNSLLDDLEELHENPFNLNTATKDDLKQLPFMDDVTIEEILAYIYRYGPLQSLGELKMISQLDYQVRQMLTLFVYVAPVSRGHERIKLKTLLKEGRNELSTRLDVPLYKCDGYKRYEDEVLLKNPNKIYLGNGLYHNLRYRYVFKNKVYWGFTAEKDAGEPFGSYGNRAYDSYSFHFLLKDCGKLKVLSLGDYRLSFGEGLVVNTDFSLGKITMLHEGEKRDYIKKFSSVSETSFFRGIAATFQFGRLGVSAFYSYLPVDATLRKDGTISSIKTDGLHRTLLELSKKHNVTEQVSGGNITWQKNNLSIGLTGLYQHFNVPFSTGSELYRLYYPSGKDFVNMSVDYRFRYNKFFISGETAFSNVHRGWATLNRASYRLNHKYSLVVLQRMFAYQYVGLHANTFSENNPVANESGFYVGMEAVPVNELKIFACVDYFYSPWYRYGISHQSEGIDGIFEVEWNPYRSKWNVSVRYQIKRKERNEEPYLYNKVRTQIQYMPSAFWNIRLLCRYTDIRDIYGRHTHGYMIGSTCKWREKKDRIRLSVSVVCFNSKDYKASMSFYEPSLLYAFSFINLYGNGMRTSLNGRWNITGNWMFMVKYGLTTYFDRNEISSGLQRIEGNKKSDLYFQLRYKF